VEIIERRDIKVVGEEYNPVYRVLLIEESDGPPASWPREVFGVFGGDVQDVLRLAKERAGDRRLFAVALETPAGGRETRPMTYQLTWLTGIDPKFSDQLSTPPLLEMRSRASR